MKQFILRKSRLYAALGLLLASHGICAQQREDVDGFFHAPETFIAENGANGILWTYWDNSGSPSPNWMSPTFTPGAGWQQGRGGFFENSSNTTDDNTTAFSGELLLRSAVPLSAAEVGSFMLWGRWDDSIEVYINGVLAAQKPSWTGQYQYIALTPAGRAALQAGVNTIAVRVVNSGGPGYFDMGIAAVPELVAPPVSGYAQNTALSAITDLVQERLAEALVPGAAVAVARQRTSDGQIEILYSAGFGYMEKEFNRPIPHDAVFRLASLDKPPSLAALKRMMVGASSWTYNATTQVYDSTCNPNANQNNPNAVKFPDPQSSSPLNCDDSVLDIMIDLGVISPFEIVDTRIQSITLADILAFSGNFAPRPGFNSGIAEYYAHLGITPSQSSPEQLMRWYFTNPLVRDPGTGPYNSDGSAIVRYLVDELGGGLEHYLQDEFLAGLPKQDMYIAHERTENRVRYADNQLREPWYRTDSAPTDFWIGLEDALALAATAETVAVANFRYDPNSRNWNGGMPGSQTAMRNWRINGDDVSVVWLNNSGGLDFEFNSPTNAMNEIQTLLRTLPISAWQSNSGRIRHVDSQSCIHPHYGSPTPVNGTVATLWGGCDNEARLTYSYTGRGSLQQASSGKCLHPSGGSANPAPGTPLVFWDGCDEPRLEFRIMFSGQLQHISSGLCVSPNPNSSINELILTTCNESDPKLKFEFIDAP